VYETHCRECAVGGYLSVELTFSLQAEFSPTRVSRFPWNVQGSKVAG
jgi:hypothetical protein